MDENSVEKGLFPVESTKEYHLYWEGRFVNRRVKIVEPISRLRCGVKKRWLDEAENPAFDVYDRRNANLKMHGYQQPWILSGLGWIEAACQFEHVILQGGLGFIRQRLEQPDHPPVGGCGVGDESG